MQTLLIVLIILASILLCFIVLIQNPKGGGLAAGFAGGTNIMGVKRTGDILEKGTWGLVIAILVFSLLINVVGPSTGTSSGGRADQINTGAPISAPVGTPTTPAEEAPAVIETPADTNQ